MSVCLLVITDGRDDVLAETIASLRAALTGPITRRVMYDDTGDADHRAYLTARYPEFEIVQHPAGRQGFGGAIRTAWRHVGTGPERFIWHHEDDFILNRPLDLHPLMRLLDGYPRLAQVALRRQPWNDAERAAGGVIEQHPDDYEEVPGVGCVGWLEHRRFFTTNPSLYRRSLCARGWPDTEHSEGHFSIDLFSDPEVYCAFWGGRADPPWVHHIGAERVGLGY